MTAMVRSITKRPSVSTVIRSCAAESLACLGRFAPMYCEVTTAPPVASAEKTAKTRLLIMSTRETPETAASPTAEIMTVSAIPTVMASACSKISGIISLRRSPEEKRRDSL